MWELSGIMVDEANIASPFREDGVLMDHLSVIGLMTKSKVKKTVLETAGRGSKNEYVLYETPGTG